jgi:cytochrome d ubiquinol oxidase subunit I
MTAEAGRQPWLVYGLLRTADGYSINVSAANGLFTLLGYMGLYALLSLFLLFLLRRQIEQGPSPRGGDAAYVPVNVSGAGKEG